MQRLFSTFPGAWPGAGLLLLRASAGVASMIGGALEVRTHSAAPTAAVLIATGALLLAGLWTPFVGALQAFTQLWFALSLGSDTGFHLLMAALGASLVMLGPGAWSIDARLFGRKRIDIDGLRHNREGEKR